MAAKTVTIEEAEGRLGELVETIGENDEVILKKGGQAIAKITPLPRAEASEKLPPRTVGDFRGALWIAEDFDDPLPDEFWGFDKDGV